MLAQGPAYAPVRAGAGLVFGGTVLVDSTGHPAAVSYGNNIVLDAAVSKDGVFLSVQYALGGNGIMFAPASGGNATDVVKGGDSLSAVAVDEEWLYYTVSGQAGVFRSKHDGSEATRLGDRVATHIAVTSDTVYFTGHEPGDPGGANYWNSADEIGKISVADGTTTILATKQVNPDLIVVSDGNVSWANRPGAPLSSTTTPTTGIFTTCR